jgi:hypothetical protein
MMGDNMPKKKVEEKKKEEKNEGFAFRVKIGEHEVEIKGTYEDVTKTIENLPSLVANVHKAFESVKPKTVTTLTVKTEAPKAAPKAAPEASVQSYPKIGSPQNCEAAVLRILETDWGKWRPRTAEELRDVMKSNDLRYPGRVLAETLNELADKGLVRRWNTNTGFVYILAEEKTSGSGGEQQ